MVIGIFFLAMPLAITGASFVNAWDKLEARARIIEEEDQQRAKGEEVKAEAVEEEDDDSFQNLLQCKANLSSAITSIQALMDQKLENQIVDPSCDYTSILASIQGADASLTDLNNRFWIEVDYKRPSPPMMQKQKEAAAVFWCKIHLVSAMKT